MDFLTVQMTALGAYETSVYIYQPTRCVTSQNASEASTKTSNVVGGLFPKHSWVLVLAHPGSFVYVRPAS